MPIFQTDLNHDHRSAHREPEPMTVDDVPPNPRRFSEESLRTELCEGPLPDSPERSPGHKTDDEDICSDRRELIERLKRGESPTWVPNRHSQLESIFHHGRPTSPRSQTPPKPSRTPSNSSSLLPPVQITPEKDERKSPVDARLRDGMSIERPRSALHSGDFTQAEVDEKRRNIEQARARDQTQERTQPGDHWFATSPPRGYTPFRFDEVRRVGSGLESRFYGTSPRSLSSSLSSSFAYQPPTSPLVQSEVSEDLRGPGPYSELDFSSLGSRATRRHTIFSTHSSPYASPSPRVPFRREASAPYQAHQPRRSLTSTPNFLHSNTSPSTPAYPRSRRPSLGSDSSPMQHAMVGSYEESILRGRMSTTPSKPLDFVAQIGVLGMGKCKASLKCPAHVTIPFPAVYYSYNSTAHGRSRTDDGPSPYVGQIDLENGLPNLEETSRSRRKTQSRLVDRKSVDCADAMVMNQGTEQEAGRASRTKRRTDSPRVPPGGSYRIPEKGQLQIIIKNQNKTAVKLFLVQYDLAGMEPGTKTFIRQRSYSAGPIMEGVRASDLDSLDRPILRYLVHLHICCPAKGRFYLYKSIRIVFANRVPDGKEKLRNETTWPEPRFTTYKPMRVMHPISHSTGPGATLAAEKAFRRRSSGFPLSSSTQVFDAVDGVFQPLRSSNGPSTSSGGGGGGNTVPVDPIPFRLPPPKTRPDSGGSDTTSTTAAGLRSPDSQNSRPSTTDSVTIAAPWGPSRYAKLNKGDLGYGGNAFSPPTGTSPGGTEGLLSQRLRGLGVQPEHQQHDS